MATTPKPLIDELMKLNPTNRRNTLNKRINYKGNNELMVTGGSHALDNQNIWDRNNVANTMSIANPKGIGADWTLPGIKQSIEGLNNRYEGRNEENIQFAPKDKKTRRANDIYFYQRRQGKKPTDLFDLEKELPF